MVWLGLGSAEHGEGWFVLGVYLALLVALTVLVPEVAVWVMKPEFPAQMLTIGPR